MDFGAAALFPVTMARRYKAVPVGYVDQQTLLVAAADPANVLAVDDIQIATGLDCQIAVASEEDVESLLPGWGRCRTPPPTRSSKSTTPRKPRKNRRGRRQPKCRPAPRTRP